MKMKIYIDTSVIGGFFDKEFATDTRALFKRLENNEVIFIVSDILEQELENAPQHVKDLFYDLLKVPVEYVNLSDEVKQLADCYISEKIVGPTSLTDCRHIAAATIYKADVLAS